MNIKNELKPIDILFFNFAFEANDMLLNLYETHVYQAWLDKEATILLAESNSYNSLGDQLNISVSTVRNNMNWYKGIDIMNKKGENILIYLKEKGAPWKFDQLNSQ